MDIKSSIETLVDHGIPVQDIMASAILNNARDVVVEIAKTDPEAVCTTVSWNGYASEDNLSCTELLCHAHRPSLYRAYIENAAPLPLDFEEVCYGDDDDDEYDDARTNMMKVGIQVNNAMLVGNPITATQLREAAIGYIKDGVYDDLHVYVDETLDKMDDCDGDEDEALGWFFIDAMEVLIGSKIENAWTIAHPKPTEDTV